MQLRLEQLYSAPFYKFYKPSPGREVTGMITVGKTGNESPFTSAHNTERMLNQYVLPQSSALSFLIHAKVGGREGRDSDPIIIAGYGSPPSWG